MIVATISTSVPNLVLVSKSAQTLCLATELIEHSGLSTEGLGSVSVVVRVGETNVLQC